MMKLLHFAVFLVGAVGSAAGDTGLITKESRYSVSETMDRLEAAIKERGATLYVRIDLKAAAQKGETLRPHQLVIFGRGGALAPLLSSASTSGIDLPQKILAFEDQEGKVWVVYNTGEYILQRHSIKGKEATAAAINKEVGSITDKAAK